MGHHRHQPLSTIPQPRLTAAAHGEAGLGRVLTPRPGALRSRSRDGRSGGIGYQEGRIEEARFVLHGDRQAVALDALLGLAREAFGYDLADRGLTDVDGFLRLFAIDTVREGDDIVGLRFEDRLLLELEEVFLTLGPFVEAGSYVRFHAGSGARWRYVFDGTSTTNVDEPSAPWYGR